MINDYNQNIGYFGDETEAPRMPASSTPANYIPKPIVNRRMFEFAFPLMEPRKPSQRTQKFSPVPMSEATKREWSGLDFLD